MNWTLVVRGIVIGCSVAAPVGPIGILCMRRTLAHGRLAGLVSGLGAASADAIYGAVAGFGLTALTGLLVAQAGWVRLVGGLFLCFLGWRTWRTPPATSAALSSAGAGLVAAFFSTFALTLTNPATILSFIGIFAGASGGVATGGQAAMLVLGVFVGSALWWLLLSGAVALLRGRITAGVLGWINRAAGLAMLVFGILTLARG